MGGRLSGAARVEDVGAVARQVDRGSPRSTSGRQRLPSTGAIYLYTLSWQRGRTHVRLRRSVPYPRSITPYASIHVEEYIPTVPDPGIHSSSVRIQHPATGDVMRDRTWAELDHE